MSEIKITIHGREFKARLNNSAAAQALCYQMPMTVVMDELFGEILLFKGENLPTRSVCPNTIAAGDLMLFGGAVWSYSTSRLRRRMIIRCWAQLKTRKGWLKRQAQVRLRLNLRSSAGEGGKQDEF